MTWSYDFGKDANLTSIEFRRERDGDDSPDIGNIKQDGAVKLFGAYEGYMELTTANQSATLTINRIKTADGAEYCCKLKTTKGNAEKCTRLKFFGNGSALLATSSKSVLDSMKLCN